MSYPNTLIFVDLVSDDPDAAGAFSLSVTDTCDTCSSSTSSTTTSRDRTKASTTG